MLNDTQIAELCTNMSITNEPMVSPFVPEKIKMGHLSHGLSHFGYDLSISGKVRWATGFKKGDYEIPHGFIRERRRLVVRPWDPDFKMEDIEYAESSLDGFILEPGGFILVGTDEYFNIPAHVAGIVHDKSTLARLGLAVQNTVAEPGWEGNLTVEISNHGNLRVELCERMPIGQMMFFTGDIPALLYSGRYQRQGRGAPALSNV